MTTTVAQALAQLPVTRLVHFTPVTNLHGILQDGKVRDSADLAGDPQPHHRATDDVRVDGQPGAVCCSVEYPNPYYEAVARRKTIFRNYPTWVCLLLDPSIALTPGTLFYPCNAAKAGGAFGAAGGNALLELWSPRAAVGGWARGASHHPGVPTDLQAEIQVPGPIPLSAVQAIVVESEAQAEELIAWFDMLGASPKQVEWRVSPMMFTKSPLVDAIKNGKPIPETLFHSPSPNP